MFNLLATYLFDFLADADPEKGNGLFGGRISVVSFITVLLVAAAIILCAVVFVADRKNFKNVVKYSAFGFFVYALVLALFLLVLDLIKHYDMQYLDKNYVDKDIIPFVFVPLLVSLSIALASALILFVLYKQSNLKVKKIALYAGILWAISIVVAIVFIAVYYSSRISGDGYYTDDASGFNQAALYAGAALLVILTVGAAFIFDRDKTPFDAKTIARAGICVALSFALSYVKLFQLPQGGSITLASMLPIMLFAYAYGMKKGLLIGFIYGLLQSIQDPFIIHPAQFLLDYPVAFAMLGLTGAFSAIKGLENLPRVKFALGAILASVMRFISHVISGVFAFGAYAEEAGMSNHLLYSLAYNSFVFVELAIVVIAGVILLSSKSLRKVVER
ncbi:MAG: energy-coupled thiamine transporter ThiT [Clostridia bacterium]|nr:energy-coupled thiamine transporter ThiT [Clostridia bacterium]